MATAQRLSIDARLAGKRHAGIGRYIAEIVPNLLQKNSLPAQNKDLALEWNLWVSHEDDLDWLPNPLPSHVRIHRTKVRHYSLAEQVLWPLQLRSQPSDLLWVPHFNVPVVCPFPWVVTIHDLLWHQERDSQATTLPSWKHGIKHKGYQFVVSQAVQRAERIIVPTQVVSDDVTTLFPEHAPINITSEGIPELYRQVKLPLGERKASTKLLSLGSQYPHKNTEVILQALRVLPEFTLDIVTTRSVFVESILQRAEQLGVASQVHYRGFLSDNELRDQAGEYFALVQPSRSEGFGLTGLEAMALGIPVLANNTKIFHEVYKTYAEFFQGQDPQSLVQSIRLLQKNPWSRAQLQRAQEHARSFSWERSASLTWKAILQAWRKRYEHA